jgi:hypothetical protein
MECTEKNINFEIYIKSKLINGTCDDFLDRKYVFYVLFCNCILAIKMQLRYNKGKKRRMLKPVSQHFSAFFLIYQLVGNLLWA